MFHDHLTQPDKQYNSVVDAANTKGSSVTKVATCTFCELARNSLTWLPVELHIKVTLRVVLHPHGDQILRDLKGRRNTKGQGVKIAKQGQSK